MKAIILAAGYGTRMRPLSDHMPKPLIPVLGKPLVWHIITKLAASKVDWIGVNVHHHAAQLQAYIETISGVPHIEISHEKEILGSGGALNGFKKQLDTDSFVIIHNGDVLSSIPLAPLIAAWQNQQPLCMLVLHEHPRYSNVVLAPDTSIIDIRDRLRPATSGQRFAYTGIAIMHSRFFEYVPQGYADMIDIVLNLIQQKKERIIGHVVQNHVWADVGTIDDYLAIHRKILIQHIPLIAAEHIPNSSLFINGDSIIEKNVCLRGFVSIGKNCIIKSGSVIEDSIIWDNTVISKNSILKNSIAGKGFCVTSDRVGHAAYSNNV
ncbi:MAG: NDP-sugar synthase [Desulfobacterota bacterium]|nr:NDP-sugar synthase [Thermodesulfobacteriota bacterium]